MKRFLGIGVLVLALALVVPAAVLAFSSVTDDRRSANVPAAESDGSTETAAAEEKPWVGLYIMDVTERLAEKLDIDAEDGVAVVKVVEDGPADDAGIEQGDVIVSIDAAAVSTVSGVRDAVGAASVGDTLAFTIERDGSESTYDVTIGERPSGHANKSRRAGGKGAGSGASGIGAAVAALNADLADKLDIETEDGVVVVRVAADSPADDAGLQAGDVIVSVDGAAVESLSDVVSAVRDAEVGDTLTIVVAREGEASNLSLDVTVEEGYGFRGAGLNLRGLGNLRGVLSGGEDGPVNITVSRVTVKEIGEDSLTLAPTEDGNDNIQAAITDGSIIVKDGAKVGLDDLAVDDEGFAAVIDGELSVLFIGSFDSLGRGHGRFGGNDGDDSSARPFGRGFGGGTLTLPPGTFDPGGSLGPLNGFRGTLDIPQPETTT